MQNFNLESFQNMCLQPNQISQGFYKCSPMAKRILAYTISNLKICKWSDEKAPSYEVIFKQVQFAKALGMQRLGTKQQELIKQALKELQASFVAIDTGDLFRTFAWISSSLYSPKDRLIYITLNPKLGEALLEFQKGFTTIQLIEMGKLQSFYAMRYYEIAQSWNGKKGQGGNQKNEWWFEYSIQELRATFQLKDDEYSGRMNNFCKYVIEQPLKELNEKTNLHIECYKLKDGKFVEGFRFVCSENFEKIKHISNETYEEREEINQINQDQESIEIYKKKYPKEFSEIYKLEKSQQNLFGFELLAESNVVQKLKEMEKAKEI